MYQPFAYLLGILSLSLVPHEAVDFYDGNFESALQRAKWQQKNLLVAVSAKWCTPCQMMEEHTFTNDEVSVAMQRDYIALKYDIDSEEGMLFALEHEVKSLPAIYVFSPAGEKITEYRRAVMPTEMMEILDAYKDVNELPVVEEKRSFFQKIFGKRD